MSRIGKLPIEVPAKVEVTISEATVSVKGPNGALSEQVPGGVSIKRDGAVLEVVRDDDSQGARGAQGLARTLIANMVTGVSEGFAKTLIVNGVGYRVEQKGAWLLMNLGFAHPVLFELPEGITAEIDSKAKEPKLTLKGASKQAVGSVAAQIRALRPPEPYKGKGIRYSDETIRRKAGKTGGKK